MHGGWTGRPTTGARHPCRRCAQGEVRRRGTAYFERTLKMKAIVQHHYGDASTLTFEDVARPRFGEDDVLVQVAAAGVDRGALHFMTGQPYLMRLGTGLRTPKVTVPGVSFAGRVEAIGSQV